MAEYIDRDKLIKKFCWHCDAFDATICRDENCFDKRIINSIPKEDVAPVVHGHWETEICDDGYGAFNLFVCSECGSESARKRNYCHDCGAKMDGETWRKA